MAVRPAVRRDQDSDDAVDAHWVCGLNGLPRLAFINQMERLGADFFRVVKKIETRLGARIEVLLNPDGGLS